MSAGHPLAPLQAAVWRHALACPDAPSSASLALAVRGALDAAALRAALAELVARHEILRTRFAAGADGPAMHVEPPAPVELAVLDWSALGRVERERELGRLAARLRRPLADGRAPLSAALARLAPDEHVLVLAQHALAADWRSLWIVAGELARLLTRERLAPDPVAYADLARWLRESGEEEDARHAPFERAALAAAAALRLPQETEPDARAAADVREVARELPPRVHEAATRLAEGRGLPRAALLLAAWAAWLARLTEREELVLGAVSDGRAFQGLDEVPGPLARALPVTARVDRRTSLASLARALDEAQARNAEWHEHFDPERLGLAAETAAAHVFEHLGVEPPLARGALELRVLRRDGHPAPFHTHLRVEEGEHGCELRLAYDARRLGAADAEALLEPALALFEQALARPDAPLAELPAVDPLRRGALLALARGPELAPEPRTLERAILDAARARPDACAVRAEDGELSYGALDERSGALAAELVARGAGPGTRVGIHLERSRELVVAVLAVLRAGAAYVPLPPAWPRARLRHVMEVAELALVVGSPASADLEPAAGTLVPVNAPRATPARPPEGRAGPDDLAYVLFTSGSSGVPKGVEVTHASLAHSTRARRAVYPGAVGRFLLLSSFGFDSSVAGLFWTLAQGGTLVLPPADLERDLAHLPELLARARPTHLLALPSVWSLALERADPAALAGLELVIVAGESCPVALVERHRARLPRTRLVNEYGPTEATVWSTWFDTAELGAGARVPIGRPIPGASAYVLTPERELAPPGLAGELWVGGPGIARGYRGLPQLTAERFAADPFTGGRMYRTGDRARLSPDGLLAFLGRLDRQVKVRGVRVELEELESLLAAHPAVREAAVVALAGDGRADGDVRLVAYVLPSGPAPAETDLLRFLAERVPAAAVPERAVCLARWPTLPGGKLDRSALPPPAPRAPSAAPEGALETVLAVLWADVLGLEEVGRDDDFFALGGHSLTAVRLHARVREILRVEASLRALFEHPTPAAYARALRADPAEAARVERVAEVALSVLDSGAGGAAA